MKLQSLYKSKHAQRYHERVVVSPSQAKPVAANQNLERNPAHAAQAAEQNLERNLAHAAQAAKQNLERNPAHATQAAERDHKRNHERNHAPRV
jgi:hypothetical protein